MRFVFRVNAVLALSLLLVPTSFADSPDKAKNSETSGEGAAPATPRPTTNSEATAGSVAGTPAPAPQKPRGAGTGREAPAWSPMPATSGTLGLFTVETGETLPTKGFSFSTYVNKFSRMPGSVTVLNVGWNFGVGIRDWLTFYAGFEPLRHVHIGAPGQLS